MIGWGHLVLASLFGGAGQGQDLVRLGKEGTSGGWPPAFQQHRRWSSSHFPSLRKLSFLNWSALVFWSPSTNFRGSGRLMWECWAGEWLLLHDNPKRELLLRIEWVVDILLFKHLKLSSVLYFTITENPCIESHPLWEKGLEERIIFLSLRFRAWLRHLW